MRLSSVHPVAICAVLTSDHLHRCRSETCTSHRPPHRMNGCVERRKVANARELPTSCLIDAGRTLSHRRCGTSLPLAAVPHASQVVQKAMTGMWITSSSTAARKLGGCVSEHQIEIPA